jgi:hypothetical protein
MLEGKNYVKKLFLLITIHIIMKAYTDVIISEKVSFKTRRIFRDKPIIHEDEIFKSLGRYSNPKFISIVS